MSLPSSLEVISGSSTLRMELNSFIWYASPFCIAPWPLLCPLLVLGWVVILFGKPGTPSSLEVLLLCTATCPRAHRATAGTLSWHRPCGLPSLEQGKELECRPRSPVPSMRPDNRSCSVIVKLMEHSAACLRSSPCPHSLKACPVWPMSRLLK